MISATIIVPVYNACSGKQGPSWLNRLFSSIRSQTFDNWSALFINDGSGDDSLNHLNAFAEEDPRVTVINKDNEGVSKTRNYGISIATGDYLFFVDQDDYLESDYLETFIEIAERTKANIVIGGYRRLDERGVEVSRFDGVPGNEFYKWSITAPWARVFRTDFVQKNGFGFLDCNIGEDLFFNACAYAKAEGGVLVTDYNGYIWTYNRDSVSSTSQKGLKKAIQIDYLIDELSNIEIPATEKGYFSQFIVRYAVWYLLFSGREAKPDSFIQMSDHLMTWLRQKGYKPAYIWWDKRIACESLVNRLAVSSYYAIFSKPGIVNLFAKLYCRG